MDYENNFDHTILTAFLILLPGRLQEYKVRCNSPKFYCAKVKQKLSLKNSNFCLNLATIFFMSPMFGTHIFFSDVFCFFVCFAIWKKEEKKVNVSSMDCKELFNMLCGPNSIPKLLNLEEKEGVGWFGLLFPESDMNEVLCI